MVHKASAENLKIPPRHSINVTYRYQLRGYCELNIGNRVVGGIIRNLKVDQNQHLARLRTIRF